MTKYEDNFVHSPLAVVSVGLELLQIMVYEPLHLHLLRLDFVHSELQVILVVLRYDHQVRVLKIHNVRCLYVGKCESIVFELELFDLHCLLVLGCPLH